MKTNKFSELRASIATTHIVDEPKITTAIYEGDSNVPADTVVNTTLYKVGDTYGYNGMPHTVVEVLPEGKLHLKAVLAPFNSFII